MPARLHAFDLAIVALYLIAITLFGLRFARAHRTADRSLRELLPRQQHHPLVGHRSLHRLRRNLHPHHHRHPRRRLRRRLRLPPDRPRLHARPHRRRRALPAQILPRRDAHRLPAHRPPLRPHPAQGHRRPLPPHPRRRRRRPRLRRLHRRRHRHRHRRHPLHRHHLRPHPALHLRRRHGRRHLDRRRPDGHLHRRHPRRHLRPSATTSPAAGTHIHTVAAAAGKFHMFNFAFNLTTDLHLLGRRPRRHLPHHGLATAPTSSWSSACSPPRTSRESRLALLSSGVVIFIQFTLFLLIGAGLYVFYGLHPSSLTSFTTSNPDRIFPTFIVREMPIGIAGLLVAAILAAAMSNLSAALNSLSSTTVVDFYMHWRPARRRPRAHASSPAPPPSSGRSSSSPSPSTRVRAGGKGHVVEIGLSIASVAYGCLLGVFLLGTLTKLRHPDRSNHRHGQRLRPQPRLWRLPEGHQLRSLITRLRRTHPTSPSPTSPAPGTSSSEPSSPSPSAPSPASSSASNRAAKPLSPPLCLSCCCHSSQPQRRAPCFAQSRRREVIERRSTAHPLQPHQPPTSPPVSTVINTAIAAQQTPRRSRPHRPRRPDRLRAGLRHPQTRRRTRSRRQTLARRAHDRRHHLRHGLPHQVPRHRHRHHAALRGRTSSHFDDPVAKYLPEFAANASQSKMSPSANSSPTTPASRPTSTSKTPGASPRPTRPKASAAPWPPRSPPPPAPTSNTPTSTTSSSAPSSKNSAANPSTSTPNSTSSSRSA